MYAIIKNGRIVGGANDLATAEWACQDHGKTYLPAPDDFNVHAFKCDNGNIVRLTTQEIDTSATLAETLFNRAKTYPSLSDQLDMLWHMMDDETIPGKGSDWYNTIKAVKDQFPKP